MSTELHQAISAVWRAESASIVSGVARIVRDLSLAEDFAQEALMAALQHWPRDGLPDKPGAWLLTVARRKALDGLRHQKMAGDKLDQWGLDLDALESSVAPDFVEALDAARSDQIGDDLLRLIFTACHPVLNAPARVALTLKVVGGLSTAEIARAHLVSEPTMAQRIVRAKRTLSEARVPFELPLAPELAPRLASVLEVVYLIFNEGYTATEGDDWLRPALCEEALRLGRLLAQLAPHEPEAHGLLSLMAIQASRGKARVDAQGQPVLLMDQDRALWDGWLIKQGLSALDHAQSLSAHKPRGPGPYELQAALAACHARAPEASATDWPRIVALYDQLALINPSPVVALNRAVAVGMAEGPAAALDLVDALREEPMLARYPWLPSVRADLLSKLGRLDEARQEWLRAAELTDNTRERALLLARAKALAQC
jgi:RNA polymerase sigma factor (sigma-70 family)